MSFINRSVRAIARQTTATGTHCSACSTLLRNSSSASSSSSSAACTTLLASTSRLRIDSADGSLRRGYRNAGGARGVATQASSTEAASAEEKDANDSEKLGDEEASISAEGEASPAQVPGEKERPRYINIYDRKDPPPGPPVVEDLIPFRPRRIFVPTATSENAQRLQYQKLWNKTLKNLHLSFTKAQLSKLVELLKLDLSDKRLKLPTRRKANHLGNSKRKTHVDALTRMEMCRLILVLEWNLPDPETLPSVKRSATITEDVPISPRTLFLLLLPSMSHPPLSTCHTHSPSPRLHPGHATGSTLLQYLRENLGVKITNKQHPETQETIFTFKGEKDTIKAAKVTVENILDTAYQTTIPLSTKATTLRPEVYQNISRMAKVFLEPTSNESKLLATASSAEDVVYATKLIEHALYHDHLSNSIPLLALLSPPSFTTHQHAMYPYTSLSPTSWSLTGATTDFSRIKKVKAAGYFGMQPTLRDREDPWDIIQVDGGKDNSSPISKSAFLSSPSSTSSIPKRINIDLLQILREGLSDSPLVEGETKLEVKFGNVVWPLYSQDDDSGVMRPSKNGKWAFERFNFWRKEYKKAFISSTSPSLLAAIDTLPTPDDSFYATPTPATSEDQEPTFISTELRRFTFRPEHFDERGILGECIEVDFKEGETSAKFIKRSLVDLMVPEAATDLQVCMSTEQDITSELESSSGLSISENDSESTLHSIEKSHQVVWNKSTYILDSDKSLRRTIITPPSSSDATSTPLTFIQDRWDEQLYSEPSGVSVSVSVGEVTRDSEELGEKLEETMKDVLQVAKFGQV